MPLAMATNRGKICCEPLVARGCSATSWANPCPSHHRAKLFTAKNSDGTPYSVKQVVVAAGSILGAGEPRRSATADWRARLTLSHAGSDTTAITMRAVLRYIIGDPRIYAKVMAELEEAIEEGNLTFPVSYAEGVKLEYFQVSPPLPTPPRTYTNIILNHRRASKKPSACTPPSLGLFLASFPRAAPSSQAISSQRVRRAKVFFADRYRKC